MSAKGEARAVDDVLKVGHRHHFARGELTSTLPLGERDVHEAAVLPAAHRLEVVDLLPASDSLQDPGHLVPAVRSRDDRDRAADHLLARVAEEPFGTAVPARDDPSRDLLTMASSDESTIAASRASDALSK